jgi:hypothetical protein
MYILHTQILHPAYKCNASSSKHDLNCPQLPLNRLHLQPVRCPSPIPQSTAPDFPMKLDAMRYDVAGNCTEHQQILLTNPANPSKVTCAMHPHARSLAPDAGKISLALSHSPTYPRWALVWKQARSAGEEGGHPPSHDWTVRRRVRRRRRSFAHQWRIPWAIPEGGPLRWLFCTSVWTIGGGCALMLFSANCMGALRCMGFFFSLCIIYGHQLERGVCAGS